MTPDPIPCALWTPDCQGKQDFDGPILSLSTRYWPGPGGGGAMTFDTATGKVGTAPYGSQPSAIAAIRLHLGPRESEEDDGIVGTWRTKTFMASTEAEVKALVEAWVREQLAELIAMLLSVPHHRGLS